MFWFIITTNKPSTHPCPYRIHILLQWEGDILTIGMWHICYTYLHHIQGRIMRKKAKELIPNLIQKQECFIQPYQELTGFRRKNWFSLTYRLCRCLLSHHCCHHVSATLRVVTPGFESLHCPFHSPLPCPDLMPFSTAFVSFLYGKSLTHYSFLFILFQFYFSLFSICVCVCVCLEPREHQFQPRIFIITFYF